MCVGGGGYLFGFSAQSQTKSFIHFGLPDLKYVWCLKIHFNFRCYSRGACTILSFDSLWYIRRIYVLKFYIGYCFRD